jgi:hypothetical protein
MGNRNVSGIAPLSDEHSSDTWSIVAWIKRIPMATDKGFKPTGEISGGPWLWRSNIAEITRAIPRGDIHAATEGDG